LTLHAAVRTANAAFDTQHPGETGARQPVHTVYGGGHLFRAETAAKLGALARKSLSEFAPDASAFAAAVGLPGDSAFHSLVYERVLEKLHREPVEDYRIDFEDGYGVRPDAEEDAHAAGAAREIARGLRENSLPAFVGIRVKPLTEESKRRSISTLDLFVHTLVRETGGALPTGLVFTLPKIVAAEQVSHFVHRLADLEAALQLPEGTLRFEIMVETPQMIIDETGRCPLPSVIDAGQGRITAAHFGTYDYSAACGVSAAHQRMQHDACQHALRVMQVALAGRGVWLSDGATTSMPVPVHRHDPDGRPLTATEEAENRASVQRGWRLHYDDVRHSLINGFYQGWDLHPSQLPTRYAAVYAFFLEELEGAGARLKAFLGRAAQATLVGNAFDDAATGQGLLNFFVRAINGGAITIGEATACTGLSGEDLRGKSFVQILGRRSSADPS